MSVAAVLRRLVRALGAARAFLRGFAGLPAPHLHGACTHDAASARKALEDRAGRRRSCC